MEQAIGLRFAEIQVLEETEEFTDFPEGQTDGVNQMGNGQENFNAEFAAAENPRNFAVSIVWSAVDFVGDEDCLTGFNPPDRPDMGQVAQVGSDAPGEDFFSSFGLLDFFSCADASAPFIALRFFTFGLATFLLALFFGPRRIGLIKLCRGGTDLFFQFGNALLRCLQFLLQGGNEIDQPTGVDPSLPHILFQFLQFFHVPGNIQTRASRQDQILQN